MGLTHVTTKITNLAAPDRSWEGLFLVDTGAIDCLVPGRELTAIGLKPEGSRMYELADGTEMELDIAFAKVEFMGDMAAATVIFGPDDVEPILGVTPLESVGITIDPRTQSLKRLPAVSLK